MGVLHPGRPPAVWPNHLQHAEQSHLRVSPLPQSHPPPTGVYLALSRIIINPSPIGFQWFCPPTATSQSTMVSSPPQDFHPVDSFVFFCHRSGNFRLPGRRANLEWSPWGRAQAGRGRGARLLRGVPAVLLPARRRRRDVRPRRPPPARQVSPDRPSNSVRQFLAPHRTGSTPRALP